MVAWRGVPGQLLQLRVARGEHLPFHPRPALWDCSSPVSGPESHTLSSGGSRGCSQLGEGLSWDKAQVPAGSVGKGSSLGLSGLLRWLTEEQMLKCSTAQDHGSILH